MDNKKVNSKPNPRETANIFSVLTWTWTIPLFKKGYSKALEIEDLYDPFNKDRSNILGDRLENQWFIEKQRAKREKCGPSFLWAIFRTFTPEILLLGFIQLFTELVFKLATPLLLGALLQSFKRSSNASFETAIYYTIGMVVANFFTITLFKQTVFIGVNVGGRARIAACSIVYRKALRLSKTALGETSPGKIVNLIANDVNRFGLVFILMHYMWSAPLSAVIVTVLLYLEIGWTAFIGMGIVLLSVPLQAYLGKLTSKYRLQTSLRTDERVRLMDEIISGVQVIKMYAWEKAFCALIELTRRLELAIVKKSSYINGIFMTFFMITTHIALFSTLVTMTLRGQELTAQKVFVCIAYFNLLSSTVTTPFIRGIVSMAECKVAINRIQNFLMFEEFQSNDSEMNFDHRIKSDEKISNKLFCNNVMKNSHQITGNQEKYIRKYESVTYDHRWAIKLNHVTAKWDLHSTKATLNDIDLEVDKGKLYIVIGTVGAGKSSFISTILGELTLLQGSTEVNGSISYADQDAWIFGTTVRQNILFGQDFDSQRYSKVIGVCALQQDFQQFPNGDESIVGERGCSLSGGQKARINLARAVYREADIYLLDDPLSAVDARVGKHLFEECVQKYLSGRTRILATHQLQFIKKADAILLLDEGNLHHFDNYHELLHAYPEYNSLIAEEKEEEPNEETAPKIDGKRNECASISTQSQNSKCGIKTDKKDDDDKKTVKDASLESTSRGTVKGSLLVKYVKCGANNVVLALILGLYLATQICVSLTDSFIPVLVDAEESRDHFDQLHENVSLVAAINNEEKLGDEKDILPRDYYMHIYAGLVFSIFLLASARYLAFYRMCLRASQRLHDLAFAALIRATMRFFNNNPSGRILNRFSKDLGTIDELLPRAMMDAGQYILTILGAIIVTCTINFWFLLPVLLIGILSYFIRMIYLKTSKNIKRLDGMSRSPGFTHMNATLNGLATIRAYRAEDILKKEFDNLQDTHTSSWYMYIATGNAFGFSLDLCCFIFTGVVTFSCLLLKEHFTGGTVGLAITQVMSLTGLVQMGIRQSAEVTNQLMSVERVMEYSQLPSEPNLRDKGILMMKKKKKLKNESKEENLLVETPEDWPSKGQIEFKNVSMRYSNEDPPVLKNLNFTIRSNEKVGIVGRTGAGKSSLISALLRLAEVEGVIEIDGIDTGTIALEDLRKNISIIPQDPVLFSGTLRRNLDPFNEFSDQQLYEVLEEVELKESVKSSENGLDHQVLDRGSNYSTGQRQLICLARAILRNNQILMLDEATANVDPHTDALIQRTIRTKFASCTVLTVAHRLNTVIDCDRILMLDEGQVVEFDHPYLLLQKENGSFTSLVRETGQSEYIQLQKVAENCYVSKYAGTQ